MDIARRPYTTRCRPWAASDEEVNIVWYPVPWTNPVLGFPSKIQSLDQCSRPWAAEGVGEVYGAPRVYNAEKVKPFVDGRHVCGNFREFNGEIPKDDSIPPVIYAENGLPVCCAPPVIGQGGGEVGGVADVEVVSSLVYSDRFVSLWPPPYDGFFGDALLLTITPDQVWEGTATVLQVLESPLYTGGDWFLRVGPTGGSVWTASSTWDGTGSYPFTHVSGFGPAFVAVVTF